MNASWMGCFGSSGNEARYPIRCFSGDCEAAASGRVSRPTMTTTASSIRRIGTSAWDGWAGV